MKAKEHQLTLQQRHIIDQYLAAKEQELEARKRMQECQSLFKKTIGGIGRFGRLHVFHVKGAQVKSYWRPGYKAVRYSSKEAA